MCRLSCPAVQTIAELSQIEEKRHTPIYPTRTNLFPVTFVSASLTNLSCGQVVSIFSYLRDHDGFSWFLSVVTVHWMPVCTCLHFLEGNLLSDNMEGASPAGISFSVITMTWTPAYMITYPVRTCTSAIAHARYYNI